ncbi:ABC transporter substrate-binding protein [Beijerinckia sp. L45]|uniref:ABC transporter substrate-binding protein n=1 Tax=Beijerinckia sp. L45 TaxID=1641855 RepID=UPI00131CFC23|nr:ABC transporter substrate-binding protein [Beijerinckia sp. L45]
MKSLALYALAALAAFTMPARAESVLIVGDQKGGSRALMEAAGVLKDTPYTIDWKEFVAAAPLLEALNAGAIDTGIVGDAPFTFAKAVGLKAKAIAAVRQNPGGLAILVSKASPIVTADDLKGKKIATGRGSIGHQLLVAFLEKKGWAQDAVRTTFLLPSDAKIAYSTGSVDAWSTWEPYVAQEEVLFGARRIVTGEGLTPGLTYQVARDDAIATKRAMLEDFITRLSRARTWSLSHIDDYAATWGKLVGLPPKVPQLWLSRAQIKLAPIDDSVVTDEQNTIDLYVRNNLIKTKLKADDIVDKTFAGAIEKGAATP